MEPFSCCGTDCSQCSYLGKVCRGCTQSQGRPFYSPDAPCAIYQCAVLERDGQGRDNATELRRHTYFSPSRVGCRSEGAAPRSLRV